ncbi:chalcone synthase-like protein [Clohesyomyces aquaticus]|uniref:Chalcone synthase-like protein n=1 Tax=Clohesyomyces aquaticus TaxID=1231657 RepID=A0A1Y1ZIB6_9PLEO|nr:chalcone synthase-like protein [Clohesyomyces aquaticus]
MGSCISKPKTRSTNDGVRTPITEAKIHKTASIDTTSTATQPAGLYITGLAREYPPYRGTQQDFEQWVTKILGDKVNEPVIQKLLHVNRNSGITARPYISDWRDCPVGLNPLPIDRLCESFQTIGVDLAVRACEKALTEAKAQASDITHTVGVTCSDTGNPGYDLFVAQKLGLHPSVERTLLAGVGCAGGLAALRQAANLASAATQKGQPARVLVFACEICSNFLQGELDCALKGSDVRVAPALFGDGAAALVVCNGLALDETAKPIYDLLDWGHMVVPGTAQCLNMLSFPTGFLTTLTKEVPKHSVAAITPMWHKLRHSIDFRNQKGELEDVKPSDCDWAIHPGGGAILSGAQSTLGISEDHIRASWEIYRNFGNTSSPTVLIVLDQLRRMGEGRDNVVATSFGPGMSIEMFTMRRWRAS